MNAGAIWYEAARVARARYVLARRTGSDLLADDALSDWRRYMENARSGHEAAMSARGLRDEDFEG
jgi:hypothetical protein